MTPVAREDAEWRARHQAKLAEIVANSNREYGVVFIGDSALANWEMKNKYNWRYWFSNGGKLREERKPNDEEDDNRRVCGADGRGDDGFPGRRRRGDAGAP